SRFLFFLQLADEPACRKFFGDQVNMQAGIVEHVRTQAQRNMERDRKSTRLNSSHVSISYAVFCLKKKKKVVPTYGLPDTVQQLAGRRAHHPPPRTTEGPPICATLAPTISRRHASGERMVVRYRDR